MATTHVVAVIDESTSMWHLTHATIDGFNEYTDQLKQDSAQAEETNVSLVKFGGDVRTVYTNKPLLSVDRLDERTYVPNGSTALYDAIGSAVGAVTPKVAPEDKVIVLVITDGFENSSKEFRKDQILALITERENRGNWTFVYLGANQDAMAEGTSFGVKAGNTMTYSANADATAGVYSSLASNTVSLRGKSKATSDSFFTEENEPEIPGSTFGTTDSK